jgi:hypothetical protein
MATFGGFQIRVQQFLLPIPGSIEDPETLRPGAASRIARKRAASQRDEEEGRVEAACSSLPSLRLYVSL